MAPNIGLLCSRHHRPDIPDILSSVLPTRTFLPGHSRSDTHLRLTLTFTFQIPLDFLLSLVLGYCTLSPSRRIHSIPMSMCQLPVTWMDLSHRSSPTLIVYKPPCNSSSLHLECRAGKPLQPDKRWVHAVWAGIYKADKHVTES